MTSNWIVRNSSDTGKIYSFILDWTCIYADSREDTESILRILIMKIKGGGIDDSTLETMWKFEIYKYENIYELKHTLEN